MVNLMCQVTVWTELVKDGEPSKSLKRQRCHVEGQNLESTICMQSQHRQKDRDQNQENQ